MKRKTIVRVAAVMTVFAILLFVALILFIQPWADKKIRSVLKEQKSPYMIDVDAIHVSLFNREVELDKIRIYPRDSANKKDQLFGKISSITCSGIHVSKLLFNNELDIHEIHVAGTDLNGEIPFNTDSAQPIVLPMDFLADDVYINTISFSIRDTSSPKRFIMRQGELKFSKLMISKGDTLKSRMFNDVDLSIPYFAEISADSMYTFSAKALQYNSHSKILSVDSFTSHPNFGKYAFTGRREHVTSRMDAVVSNLSIQDFSLAEYIQTGNFTAMYIELGRLDLEIFKDARKKPNRKQRPMLQEMIYNYPAVLKIDSLFILSGDIVYEEHGTKSNQPGKVRFDKMEMQAYCITNDSIALNEDAMFEIIAKTYIMGKSEFRMHMKAALFDPDNKFTFKGSAASMQAEELNPILEKNAYVIVNSGSIDKMYFNFSANNYHSSGSMVLLYRDLHLTLKNRNSDDTSAMKERFLSILANMKVKDANPLPGQEIRTSEIYFERNTEKYMINYCFKSILSGILSSIANTGKKKNK